ncbi:hypothetical protein RJT34_12738 [Clitoria ternatea]|uniref:J domain-containing protein n=1 Tax=Clitoria ternatea TaxID=43366 RepID=A0AAN9PLN9_CLITE
MPTTVNFAENPLLFFYSGDRAAAFSRGHPYKPSCRKLWRRGGPLAKLYHPDAAVRQSPENAGGEFIEIRNVYEMLSDPSVRAMYDLSLTAVNGGRHRRYPSQLSRNMCSEFYTTRRWETDQCW